MCEAHRYASLLVAHTAWWRTQQHQPPTWACKHYARQCTRRSQVLTHIRNKARICCQLTLLFFKLVWSHYEAESHEVLYSLPQRPSSSVRLCQSGRRVEVRRFQGTFSQKAPKTQGIICTQKIRLYVQNTPAYAARPPSTSALLGAAAAGAPPARRAATSGTYERGPGLGAWCPKQKRLDC